MTRMFIAACLGEDFLAQALHREYRHVPGALDVAGMMTWDDLNQILATHRLQPPRMRLSRDGETLLVGGYTPPVATRRHTVWHRLHPAELHARFTEGASLALDSVDELHPSLARLCEAIERDLRIRVQANLYASWTSLQTHTTTDLMAWVSEQLLRHEDWRRDLPLLAASDVQADAVDGMRKRLAELLDDPALLARCRAVMDGQAVGRMAPSLPYIDTVPADGGLRVRLTTARAVLDVGEDTVTLSAAGSTFEFAPAAEAVLRPLVDGRTVDLATLAYTAGLALEDVIGLVQELIAGQAATVGSLL
ncbi:winged helix domain-containing protein [Streptomyces sp. QTS52]